MIIDICLVLMAGLGFWVGYTRGILGTLFSVVTYLVALLLTFKCAPWVMDLFVRWFHMDKLWALIAGSLLCFIALILLIRWMVKSIENHLQKSRLNSVQKIFGGVVMMLIAVVIFSFLLWPVNQLSWVPEKVKTSSHSYAMLESIPQKTRSFLAEFKPLFHRYWDTMQESVQKTGAQPPE